MIDPNSPPSLPGAQRRPATVRRLAIAACFAVPLLAVGCSEDASQDDDAPSTGRAVQVTWIEARSEELREVRRAVGSLEALSRPLVAAEVDGVVERIHFDEGETVQRGDLLAEIEGADHRDRRMQAAADVARLTAQLEVQERSVRRAQELHAEGHLSDDELDNAEAELESREQQLSAALAQLHRAERDLQRTQIRAGTSGAVETRHISEGDYVQMGEPLFQLLATERLRARIPVAEGLASRIGSGTPLSLRSRSGAGTEVETTVSTLSPQIGSATRSLQLLAEIDNPGDWRPGGSVEAELLLDLRNNIVLPGQAVVRRPNGHVVYLLDDGAETVTERRVEIGMPLDDRVEIASGLSAGERIVVDGAGFLTDGATVRAEPRDPAAGETE